MGTIERQWQQSISRRKALASLAGLVAGSPLLHAQLDPRHLNQHRRTPGLAEMFSSFDFEPVMFANVPQSIYDYTAHGEGGESNLRRNRQAFDWVDLVPGRAVDPATVDLSTEILGIKMKYPIMIAPTGTQVPLHPDGEAGMYRAATMSAGTPMCLSNASSLTVEEVAKAAQGQLWWQFYPRADLNASLGFQAPDMAASRELLERAQAAGCKAIVVTVDQQASYFERSLHDRNLGGRVIGRGGGGRGAGAGQANATPLRGPQAYRLGIGRLWISWEYLDGIKKFMKVPMIIKGIVSPEDAKICVERGYDGIIVSNHGGRSMDYGPSTLEVLPEIVAAVNGRIPVLIDSGFRRGSDVLKALALGADAVFFGRASRWALGAFGPQGVQRLLDQILFKELVEATAVTGRTTLASIDLGIVKQNWP